MAPRLASPARQFIGPYERGRAVPCCYGDWMRSPMAARPIPMQTDDRTITLCSCTTVPVQQRTPQGQGWLSPIVPSRRIPPKTLYLHSVIKVPFLPTRNQLEKARTEKGKGSCIPFPWNKGKWRGLIGRACWGHVVSSFTSRTGNVIHVGFAASSVG
ncbi:hypothetical protein LY78DRAFT_300052 [Colletotrichum sublineola]|nr:hypothetical protein LY78DRAFT_300052 [Colletotrichum sublineola]